MTSRILPLLVALSAAACTVEVDDSAEPGAEALDVHVKTQSVCMIGVRGAGAQMDGDASRLVVDTGGCGLHDELHFLLSPISSLEERVVDLTGAVEANDEWLHDAHGVWGRRSLEEELGYLHVMIADEGDVVAELEGDALFDADGYPYRFDGELWVVR